MPFKPYSDHVPTRRVLKALPFTIVLADGSWTYEQRDREVDRGRERRSKTYGNRKQTELE